MEKINCTNCETNNSINSKYCSRCGFTLSKIEPRILSETLKQPLQDKKKMRGKRLLTFLLSMTLVFIIQQLFFSPPSFDKAMIQIASELNKTCPITINAETRLDNAIALPDNVFQYFFTLVNAEKSELDIDAIKNEVMPHTINNVKSSPELKLFRDHNTTLTYSYKDNKGVFLFEFAVTPDLYK